jgi:thiol-disulfide isomerase/thioredoxin
MSRRQHLLWWGAGAAAAAAGAGWSWWRSTGNSDVTDPGPDFWALRFERPEGGELALTSLRGKVLVLNFWATWCPPCIKELPEFDRLQRAKASAGVQVVGLAVDGPTPVRQFLARQPVGFPVGLAGFEGTDLSKRLGNTAGALPFTVVFDRQGRLRHRKLGQTVFDELETWVNQA